MRKRLLKRIEAFQNKKDASYNFFRLSWYRKKGLYQSNLKVNFTGNRLKRFLRNYFINPPDNNLFVTTFVVSCFLELYELGEKNVPKKSIDMAIKAILDFKDRNNPDVDAYTFWEQRKNTNGTFSPYPTNFARFLAAQKENLKHLNRLLQFLKLKKLLRYFSHLSYLFHWWLSAFQVPPDTDDTSLNIILGYMLEQNKSFLPESYRIWKENNRNTDKTIQKYIKYSYKPFENSQNNLIDVRTYFLIRDFLHLSSNKENGENFSLISTWMMNNEETKQCFPDISIPNQINNVELAVCANSFLMMNHYIVFSDKNHLNNPDFFSLYKNTMNLILWSIEEERVFKRPDISLLYYPNLYSFYWTVSKSLFFLRKAEILVEKGIDPYLVKTRRSLERVLKKNVIDQMLAKMKRDGDWIYWESFLGNGDGLPSGGEDRLYSTGLAINALIDIYSEPLKPKHPEKRVKREWRSDLPPNISDIIHKAIDFVELHILKETFPKNNAVFSGAVKGETTDHHYYPANYGEFIDGTPLADFHNHPEYIGPDLIYGVEGVIDEEQYRSMLKKSWLHGKPLAQEFEGFNAGPFVFWSAPVMSYAVNLLALEKFHHLNRYR